MKKRILVVDDTKNIRMLLTTCLEIEGFEVVTSSDAFDALEKLKDTNFDLAFIDIKMPEMSGTELLKQIRDLNLTIPVVIMTAFATVKNAVDCTKLGAIAYLQKPFTANKVRSLLDELNLISKEKEELDSLFDLAKKLFVENPCNREIYNLLSNAYEKKGMKKEATIFKNIENMF